MMSYPASYRRAAPGEYRRGFQSPVPQNDNYRSPWKRAPGTAVPVTADNDAHRRRVRLGHLNVGKLARIHPGLRAVGYVHDFYQFYTDVKYALAAQPEGFSGGFTLYHRCEGNLPGDGMRVGRVTDGFPTYTCIAGQGNHYWDVPEAQHNRIVRIRHYNIQPSGLPRHQKYDEWRRPLADTGTVPRYIPAREATFEFIVQNPLYEHWPYKAIPYWKRNPYLSPTEQTDKGPAPRRRAVPFAPGNPDGTGWDLSPKPRRPIDDDFDWDPDRDPRPGDETAPRPGFGGGGATGEWGDDDIRPARPPQIKPTPLPLFFPRPPGPGVKEKKFVIHGPTGALNKIISIVGEGVEFVESFYDALPWELRRQAFVKNGYRKLTPQQQAALIYTHINSLDWPTALRNVTLNQFEDAFFGRLGQGAADLARRAGVSHGFQLGPTI